MRSQGRIQKAGGGGGGAVRFRPIQKRGGGGAVRFRPDTKSGGGGGGGGVCVQSASGPKRKVGGGGCLPYDDLPKEKCLAWSCMFHA